MGTASILLAVLLAASPKVELSTLKGEQHIGELQSLSAETVTLAGETGPVTVPLADVLKVRFPAPADETPDDPKLLRVWFVDGSQLAAQTIATDSRTATVGTVRLGEVSTPIDAVSSIRFGPLDSKVEASWADLRSRTLQKDLLVIRKNDVLDHLSGVVGTIDEEHVRFLLGGNEVPVKRANVFGVVYARDTAPPSPRAEMRLAGGDVAYVKSFTVSDGTVAVQLAAGAKVAPKLEDLRVLDFSLGKVRYLSDLEPRTYELTPLFDGEAERSLFRYRRDRNQRGEVLKLAGVEYPRGLWIHSRTRLVYRIGGDYRRFQAVMGIDDDVARRGLGDVHVVITGDGKPLVETDVKGADKPVPLDLDVSGIRDLEILVDFGGDIDIADHLDLADAKVLK
ncbi:MAG: NPCBM/NEW2 domain-containing protein [Planctomycetes bacterium]|nr:NPCBM/NEW2 domain-containing protein [Planctomycetota bacterium]